ncbi:hypothetical protein POL68_35750 [Stigmatella sp. ncwal1]|uniref:Outer membrane protein beta-barrel domain-containing protein n=1 Tax=Stigmatella ashevillensis TaxID=2995309 RepID=A0ABT5DJP2_9BACT|nr:hypothetical protein [Stigmatella ashevillena]MDC0713875.1 hypothetical protein [Stigmatella ashevillena]
MRFPLLTSLLALSVGLPVWGQDASESSNPVPDESWLSFPGQEAPPPPVEAMPVPPLPPRREAPTQEVEPPRLDVRRVEVERVQGPNRVSLHGAVPLARGQLAASLLVGFPLASAHVSFGVLPRLDVGGVVNSLYGIMNEVNARVRFTVLEGEVAQLALGMEGGHAFFLKPQSREVHGGRYFTGRRDWNLMPGLAGSAWLWGKSRSRVFLDLRYLLSIDTDPFLRTPLGGVPDDVQTSGNVLFRTGLEVPFSESSSYVIMLGGNIHGRPEDADFMPTISFGVVAGM